VLVNYYCDGCLMNWYQFPNCLGESPFSRKYANNAHLGGPHLQHPLPPHWALAPPMWGGTALEHNLTYSVRLFCCFWGPLHGPLVASYCYMRDPVTSELCPIDSWWISLCTESPVLIYHSISPEKWKSSVVLLELPCFHKSTHNLNFHVAL
jgi:hypothetical protein